jgi:hypothetical protein
MWKVYADDRCQVMAKVRLILSFGSNERIMRKFNEIKEVYHILVDDKAKILPCNKTLSFV